MVSEAVKVSVSVAQSLSALAVKVRSANGLAVMVLVADSVQPVALLVAVSLYS